MGDILVTGSQGQLGRSIQDIAKEYPTMRFVFVDKSDFDLNNLAQMKSYLEQHSFVHCINCAAYTNVEQAEKQPEIAYAVNAEGVKNLASCCSDFAIILTHVSTDYVFDGKKEGSYTTLDIPNPINVYGRSKLQGEQYIQDLLQRYYIVRTSWLYSNYGKNFYTTILAKAQLGETLEVTDSQIGCPTKAENLARFIVSELILLKRPFGVYHYTDGLAMTWHDFAQRILEENGLQNCKLILGSNYRTFAARPKNSTLKSTEIKP